MPSDTSIWTYTGKRVDPLAMRPADVDPADVAHALAATMRFGGHTVVPFSVAEHSLDVAARVADLGGTPVEQLWGLLHDAGETYLPDVVSPIKGRFYVEVPVGGGTTGLRSFAEVENRILDAVAERFGLPPEMPARVKQADAECCLNELEELLSAEGEPVVTDWGYQGALIMTSCQAEAAFLDELGRLLAEIEADGEAA